MFSLRLKLLWNEKAPKEQSQKSNPKKYVIFRLTKSNKQKEINVFGFRVRDFPVPSLSHNIKKEDL
jgi:hypothetical protein